MGKIFKPHSSTRNNSRLNLATTLVPPYHHDIVMGIATYWMELFTAVQDIDVAYVPSAWAPESASRRSRAQCPGTEDRLVGVVSEQAPTYALSFEQKKIVEAPATTKLADGLACRLGNGDALESCSKCRPHRPRDRR